MTRWLGVTLLLLGTTIALIAASSLPLETSQAYLDENGPIELATAYLWFTLALVLLVVGASRHALLFPGFVCVLAGLRELDAHKLTSESVTSLGYWTRDVAPMSEKIVAAVLIASALTLFVVGIRRSWRDFASSLAAGHGWAWSLATMVLATPVLMIVEKTGRYYRYLTGMTLDPATRILSVACEEVGELMLPVIGFVALGQHLERLATDLGSGESKPGESPR